MINIKATTLLATATYLNIVHHLTEAASTHIQNQSPIQCSSMTKACDEIGLNNENESFCCETSGTCGDVEACTTSFCCSSELGSKPVNNIVQDNGASGSNLPRSITARDADYDTLVLNCNFTVHDGGKTYCLIESGSTSMCTDSFGAYCIESDDGATCQLYDSACSTDSDCCDDYYCDYFKCGSTGLGYIV